MSVTPRTDNKMMVQGRLLAMESALLDDLNKGAVRGNQVIRDCISSKASILTNLALATANAGIAESLGQEISGVLGIAGGLASIGGGLAGMRAASGELGEINAANTAEEAAEVGLGRGEEDLAGVEGPNAVELDDLAANPERVQLRLERVNNNGPDAAAADAEAHEAQELPQAAREAAERQAKLNWMGWNMGAQMLQGAGQLTKAFSDLATAPMTALKAREQAAGAILSGVSETTSNLTGSTESAVQSQQSMFGQVAAMPSQSLQFAVALAQAH